jgi:hypothetical protein
LTSKQYGTNHGFIFERVLLEEEEKKLEGKERVRITLGMKSVYIVTIHCLIM